MPGIIRKPVNDEEFRVDPQSECCKAPVMYFNRAIGQYTKVPMDFYNMPKFTIFVCFACSRELDRDKTVHNKCSSCGQDHEGRGCLDI